VHQLIRLTFHLSAIYLGSWVVLFLLLPDLTAELIYGSELTPVLQKAMINNVFLRSTLVCLCWYLPYTPESTRISFAYYTGGFWLLVSFSTLIANLALAAGPFSGLAIFRLIVETSIGVLFIIAAKRGS